MFGKKSDYYKYLAMQKINSQNNSNNVPENVISNDKLNNNFTSNNNFNIIDFNKNTKLEV